MGEVSHHGHWCAVIGMPDLGVEAAAEYGVELEHLALIPHPGPQWERVLSTVIDGFTLVAIAPSGGRVDARTSAQTAARLRQHGTVLIAFGEQAWDTPDLTLTPVQSVWHGIGQGSGRLRARELTIESRGKGNGVDLVAPPYGCQAHPGTNRLSGNGRR